METKDLSLTARELRLIQYCVSCIMIHNLDSLSQPYLDSAICVLSKIDKIMPDFHSF